MINPKSFVPLPSEVVVYGAGAFGRRLAEALRLAGIGVKGIADRAEGGPVSGLERLSPQAAATSGLPILLGISNPSVSLSALGRDLAERGATDVWSPVQCALSLHEAGVSLENYWMTGDVGVVRGCTDDIERARTALEDAKSREVFDSTLAYRTTGKIEVLMDPEPLTEQYFPPDVPFTSPRMRFIDAGAYDGDTVRSLREGPFDVEAVLALEPDPVNFEGLCRSVSGWDGVETVVAPLAIGTDVETLRFQASGAASSSFDSSGALSVQCVSLDQLAGGWAPTHVKMDIEGAEHAALEGMRNLLTKSRPRLAISAYHTPTDHWTILNWIADLDLGYRFWMRAYGEQTFDTVLYCLVAEEE